MSADEPPPCPTRHRPTAPCRSSWRGLGLGRTEGLIYSRQGKGTFVRERGQVRRIAGDRYRHDLAQIKRYAVPELPKGTSFTRDHGPGEGGRPGERRWRCGGGMRVVTPHPLLVVGAGSVVVSFVRIRDGSRMCGATR